MNESKELTERIASITAERLAGQDQGEQEHIEEQLPEQESVEVAQDSNEDAQQQTQTAPVIQSPAAQKESYHFKRIRESLEKSEREKEQLYEILAKVNQQQPQVPQQPQYTEPEPEDNDFVSRNYIDRRLRESQQQVAQYQQALYEQMVTNQLQSQYADFSTVLSKGNIAKLRQEHPEIAQSLAANPDIATKAQATYKIIKKLGLDIPEVDYEPIKQKIEANAKKPRPAVASPLSQASSYDYQRMSDTDMKREREEMEAIIRGG